MFVYILSCLLFFPTSVIKLLELENDQIDEERFFTCPITLNDPVSSYQKTFF